MKTQHEVNGDIIPWSRGGDGPAARLLRMTDGAIYQDRLDGMAANILEYLGDDWPGLPEVTELLADLDDRLYAVEELVRQAMPAGPNVFMRAEQA